jgi:hypothetical protein
MADIKWSAFPSVGNLATGDVLVGLRAGANVRFGSLTIPWTVPFGGTGLSTTTAYALIAGGTTATGNFQALGTGTAGQLLQSGGSGALPTWTTSTFPSGAGTLNHMLRSDGTNWVQTTNTTLTSGDVLAGVTSATIGDLNFSGSTIITTGTNENLFINPNGTGRTIFDTTVDFASSVSVQIAAVSSNADLVVGTFSATQSNASVLYMYKSRSTTVGSFSAVSNGDIAGLVTARGDDGTAFQNVASIAFNVSGTVSSGIVPGQITMSTVNTAGVLTQALAISNAQVFSLTNALLPASGGLGTGTAPTAGQIPIGVTGGTYTPSAIISGAGILVANSSGSITISATGGGIGWSTIAGTSQAAAINTGYIIGNASQTTVTLPGTAAVGSVVAVAGQGAGGFLLAANTGQTIKFAGSTTTSGGSLTSAEQYDYIQVVCIVANTTWLVQSAISTGFTPA